MKTITLVASALSLALTSSVFAAHSDNAQETSLNLHNDQMKSLSGNQTLENLKVDEGSTLKLEPKADLTVKRNATINGELILEGDNEVHANQLKFGKNSELDVPNRDGERFSLKDPHPKLIEGKFRFIDSNPE